MSIEKVHFKNKNYQQEVLLPYNLNAFDKRIFDANKFSSLLIFQFSGT